MALFGWGGNKPPKGPGVFERLEAGTRRVGFDEKGLYVKKGFTGNEISRGLFVDGQSREEENNAMQIKALKEYLISGATSFNKDNPTNEVGMKELQAIYAEGVNKINNGDSLELWGNGLIDLGDNTINTEHLAAMLSAELARAAPNTAKAVKYFNKSNAAAQINARDAYNPFGCCPENKPPVYLQEMDDNGKRPRKKGFFENLFRITDEKGDEDRQRKEIEAENKRHQEEIKNSIGKDNDALSEEYLSYREKNAEYVANQDSLEELKKW